MGRRNKNIVANGENTVVGLGTVVNGDIKSEAAVIRIDGEVNGEINTKGDLVIGKDGIIKGNVTAANLNLGGSINGNATVVNKIVIESSGKLLGDISTKLLAMDESAVIQGKVSMVEETVADDKKEATAEEVKAEAKEEPKEESKEESEKDNK